MDVNVNAKNGQNLLNTSHSPHISTIRIGIYRSVNKKFNPVTNKFNYGVTQQQIKTNYNNSSRNDKNISHMFIETY